VRAATSLAVVLAAGGACSGGPSQRTDPSAVPRPIPAARDSVAGLVPAGFGTLRQDDIALRLSRFGLQVRLVPLDESVIRLLSPDSYRALAELTRSKRADLDAIARRSALRSLNLWFASFFTAEPGETRFSPREIVITNVGRDFRPLDVVPLTPGFGEQRLRQRDTQSAVLAFDGQVDLNQPLVVAYETTSNSDWGTILQRIESERALVRSRATRAAPPKPARPGLPR
jgi:hypothetical protein